MNIARIFPTKTGMTTMFTIPPVNGMIDWVNSYYTFDMKVGLSRKANKKLKNREKARVKKAIRDRKETERIFREMLPGDVVEFVLMPFV
jgi:predicted choloylglycine hydrolase